ncbi:arsenical-resistance protein [Meira miltonrushii]|uniref:Arsenical-resistance protein n=1 Tax=Meira miltonrushii TaxID=1280837 RepID=A0A316VSN9_9BASI|nr:arsenical-resistance protein [Meira miltonrushii]PWN38525.1 arsenical-resistance protein [Meira miltonrushii]
MDDHTQTPSHDDNDQIAKDPKCCPRLDIATDKEPLSQQQSNKSVILVLLSGLGWLDRLLTPLIVIAMVIGVVIGEYAPNAKENLSKGHLYGVSAPLVIGLIVMMWPILTKVPFESLHRTFQTSRLWSQIGMSLLLNWIIGPFLMLGLAWATLPDLETYRTGIIMVGLARCIAMVMIWNNIAQGDAEVCAILVIINSVLQMALYAPYCIWFINVISHASQSFTLQYGPTAISVLIYLGIPLGAGVVTRFGVMWLLGKKRFYNTFLPFFGPLSLVGLLYTIIIIFAEQSKRILDNLGPTFRTFVPLVLYFAIMWTFTFVLVWRLSLRESLMEDVDIRQRTKWGYEMAVVQAFTAGSNNFELAIAVAVAVYGADSDQALAATIGPLVEVPVLLILSWVALWLRKKLTWDKTEKNDLNAPSANKNRSQR